MKKFFIIGFILISFLIFVQATEACTLGEKACDSFYSVVTCVKGSSNGGRGYLYPHWSYPDQCGNGEYCSGGRCYDIPKPEPDPEPEPEKTEPYCFSNGCTAADFYGQFCYVNHYWCQDVKPSGYGCQDELISRAVKTAKFSKDCGTEQIDIYCPSRLGNEHNKFRSKWHDNDCGGNGEPDPICGDDVVNQGWEECDGTDGVGPHQECSNECTLSDLTYCGDNIKQTPNDEGTGGSLNDGYEECDGTDGVSENYVCTEECTLEYVPYCGDNTVDFGEECDDGLNNGNVCTPDYEDSCSYCSEICEEINLDGPYCGDGTKQVPHEECDGTDGVPSHYTCTNKCTLEYVPYCGDGVVNQLSEECDGNDGVGPHQECSNECTLTDLTYCGDETVQQPNDELLGGLNNDGFEECDENDGVGPHQTCGGLYGCELIDLTYCGDNIKQTPNDEGTGGLLDDGYEDCDGSDGVPDHYTCTRECVLEYIPYCGDGVTDFGEECDDGQDNGNVCTPDYEDSCSYCSEVCEEIILEGPYCGDDVKQVPHEECDGSQGVGPHQECSNECTLTDLTYCGDNIKQTPNDKGTGGPLNDGYEECDGTDGVSQNQECTLNCVLEDVPYCELELTKSDRPDPVEPGDDLYYHITLTNTGTGDCTGGGVLLQEYYDEHTTFVSADPWPTYSNYKWNFGVVEPGETHEIDIHMTVDECAECDSLLINEVCVWAREIDEWQCVEEETLVECPPEPYCGDNIVNQLNEECDDGNQNNFDNCRNDCTLPYCGDGILDTGEECDYNAGQGDPGYSEFCTEECVIYELTCEEAMDLGLLYGYIDDNQGYVTNDAHIAFEVGLASYQKFDYIIDNQVLYDYDTGIVDADDSIVLEVDVPDCAYQIDLFCGPVLFSLDGQRYGNRLIDVEHRGGSDFCGEEPEIVFKSSFEQCIDTDNDGICDDEDNCPYTSNSNQVDEDGDGIGNECDEDKDGDGYTADVDCDDWNPRINPGEIEIMGNGVDEDCDPDTKDDKYNPWSSAKGALYVDITMTDERDLEPGGEMVIAVSVTNKGEHKLKDIDVSVSLPDYQIRQKKQIDRLRPGETESTRFYIILPKNARGYEYLRITVDHDEYKRTIYREIKI